MTILLIAIGGALGSIARYLSSETILKLTKSSQFFPSFPWSTLCVNVLGSAIAGILYYFVVKNFDNFDLRLKNFLFVGFLGGFTTFSAFSLDTFRLINASQYGLAFAYIFSSVIFSILAIFFGFQISKILFSV